MVLELLRGRAYQCKVMANAWRKLGIAGAGKNTEQQRQDKTHAAGQDFIQGYGVLAEGAVILFSRKNTVRMSRFQYGSHEQYRRQGDKPGATALGGMAD